ncbi:hypothetical protein H2198_003842 [Neophaeococcomyces mojaviensis]|uniref:Uncharacterized protein n=1 Tax=Neophaeococcomyces mojaviensis TaxID=3383035 RepID=A0ACC3AAP6_9EURO|nr:hypothetical protein H2198_003842 [Knufia sp. JES_112]
MRPAHLELYGSQRNERQPGWSQDQMSLQGQSHQSTRRSRFEDSWIDLSSRPSSSSLASQNDRDEIITTGLQVRRDDVRRSRQLRLSNLPPNQAQPRSTSVAGSSQDEYEESESESDRMLGSSNEDILNTSNTEEEDDTQTALGVPQTDKNIFTPQPNAFSHPPHVRSVSTSAPAADSYFPPVPHLQPPPASSHRLPSNRVPTISRPERPSLTQRAASSNISPDHDAALRASLTTLLSCANAVRKDREPTPQTIRRSNQPTALRLVPESELNARANRSPSPSLKALSKRKSRESSKERHAKKLRALAKPAVASEELMLSPTMMTWFVSAGVVLVFSAISFSAGYVWGREVGRFEGQMSLDGASCGKEVMRGSRTGLSRLRLSAVSA